jgi:predicted metal-dependent HD superfamily phosphohydrolase
MAGFWYREARAKVPQSFLDRPQLNHGVCAVALREAQARVNLAAALSSPLRRLVP